MHKILIICGPTATGKTALALTLSKKMNGELVSADSQQVYKGLDSITGKDKPNDGTNIWMYDAAIPGQSFSVSQYRKLVMPILTDIYDRGKLPIVVGGTGLYIDAIIRPFETIHIAPNPRLRRELIALTVEELQRKLMKLDISKWTAMNNSDRHNPRRLIRAIEVATSGKHFRNNHKKNVRLFDALWIGLTMPMDKLGERIRVRVDKRWNDSCKEIKRFPSASSMGAREIKDFLSRKISEEQAKKGWVHDEIDYAKRQMTWFKKKSQIHWYDISKKDFEDCVASRLSAWYTDVGHD